MPTAQSQLIHKFLTAHPIGRAIAAHARYGPGHPVHDSHAAAAAAFAPPGALPGGPPAGPPPGPMGPLSQMGPMGPPMGAAPGVPMNPQLMRQMMAARQGGPGAGPLPLPNSPQPQRSVPGPGGP